MKFIKISTVFAENLIVAGIGGNEADHEKNRAGSIRAIRVIIF